MIATSLRQPRIDMRLTCLPGFHREPLVSVDDPGGYDIVISEIPSQVDGVLG